MWVTVVNNEKRPELHTGWNTIEPLNYIHLKFLENELHRELILKGKVTGVDDVRLLKIKPSNDT